MPGSISGPRAVFVAFDCCIKDKTGWPIKKLLLTARRCTPSLSGPETGVQVTRAQQRRGGFIAAG